MNWQPERDHNGDRYLGLTALQFDFAMVGVLAAVVLTVWLAVFDAAGLDAAIGKEENAPTADGDAAAKDFVVKSAENLEAEVQSFRGVFETITRVGDLTFEMTGEMRFEAPDRMYMEMDLLGESLGILLDPPSMYVNLPGQGWHIVSQEIPGFDSEAFEEYLDNRGVVDYAQQMDQLANLEQLADEEVDGVLYHHFAGDLDLESVLSEIPEELVNDPQIDEVLNLFDNVTMKIWLDRDSLLPRRYVMLTVFEIEGESVEIEVSMDFFDYNQPVNVPLPPADAPPLDFLVRA